MHLRAYYAYKEVKPPKNLIEAALTAVMLPFDNISDDGIEIFSHHLSQATDLGETKLIRINMNYGNVIYHWSHANLKEGIKTGCEGTIKALEEYETSEKEEGRSLTARKPMIDLLAPPKAMRAARWCFGDMQK
jgi:hypothetical protein